MPLYLPFLFPNGVFDGMKLRIDPGRIVIPKPMRKRLGLTSGTELDVVEQPGGENLRLISKLCLQGRTTISKR